MNYSLKLSKTVEKFLNKHDKVFVKKFIKKAELIAQNPQRTDLDIKRMQNMPPHHYRLRIGKYRFIYTIIEDQILIYFYDAGGRGDIYKGI